MYKELNNNNLSCTLQQDVYSSSTMDGYDSDTTASVESFEDTLAAYQNTLDLDNTQQSPAGQTVQGRGRPPKRKMLQRSNSQMKQARRECNRRAAAKCRQRRIDLTNSLLHEVNWMENENRRLQDEITSLGRTRLDLEFALLTHMKTCDNRIVVANRQPVDSVPQFTYHQQQIRSSVGRSDFLPNNQHELFMPPFLGDVTVSSAQNELITPSTEAELLKLSASNELFSSCVQSDVSSTQPDLLISSPTTATLDLPSISVVSEVKPSTNQITRPSSLPLSSTTNSTSDAVILETPVFEEVIDDTPFTSISSPVTLTSESNSLTLFSPTALAV